MELHESKFAERLRERLLWWAVLMSSVMAIAHSVNLFVYVLLIPSFRRALLALATCTCNQLPPPSESEFRRASASASASTSGRNGSRISPPSDNGISNVNNNNGTASNSYNFMDNPLHVSSTFPLVHPTSFGLDDRRKFSSALFIVAHDK